MLVAITQWRKFFRWNQLLCLSLVLVACGGSGSRDCNVGLQNRLVHETMLDRYYWYRQVPSDIDYGRFDSPQATLQYLRYSALDRFSFITPQVDFENLIQNGTFIGFGFGYGIEGASRAVIKFVYTQSPAYAAGIRRGDEILSIDGQSVASLIATDGWSQVFGPARAGITLSIELRRSSGLIETLRLVKSQVIINTVLHSEIIDRPPYRIGYLVFNSFLETSVAEFAPVFAQFKRAGVNRLILDLRYNGGGSIRVARELASYIKSSSSSTSELYVQLRYNDKYQSDNANFYFESRSDSLGLDQITIITTQASCSASEQLISSLQPFFNRVTTIGGTSCGKPVGQDSINFCGLSMLAVNFAGYNAAGQGEYFSGISADCSVGDDVGFSFGDPAEPMLNAATYFVENQTCPARVRGRQPLPARLHGLQVISGAV